MSCRGKNDSCRICGGDLQGNQRRWLFGGHGKKTEDRRAKLGSSCSSPWGSTLSLGSSASLSKSQSSLNSPSKGVDLLAVLTHILGQSVPRDADRGEFACGKCVSVLERVFKFDSVISRVKALSSERLQKLVQERDKVRRWVRQNYRQRHPWDFRSRGSTSEEEGDSEREGYREMLKENMALSEYECWSEKWDVCPYFTRTGKRCRKGKGCEGCDSVRVSDSDYESICGVPRRLAFQPFSPLALSRDKSRSMPLHWHKAPFVSSSPASLAGSRTSLQASSRAGSVQSLDSLDGADPFDSPGDRSSVDFVLKELRGIGGKAISSPSGSRIPVLDKKDESFSGKPMESAMASPSVNVELTFAEVWNGEEDRGEEDGDVLMKLRDDFMPLHPQSSGVRLHQALRLLRAQLDQAQSCIRTLKTELDQGGRGRSAEVNGSDWTRLQKDEDDHDDDGGSFLLQSLGHALHSRERLIQEFLTLIRRLCLEDEAGIQLTEKLTENLKEILSDNKVSLQTLRTETTERENNLEKEIESLRKAGRDREKDLDILTSVLQSNQEIIKDLQESLTEKERVQKEVEVEKEVWRRRDQAFTVVQQEKDHLIQELKEQLQKHQEHVKVSSDSLSGHQAALLEEREVNSATLCQEVTKLTTALQEYQDMVQSQQQTFRETLSSLRTELRDARQKLKDKEKEKKEAERMWKNCREDREREDRKLKDSLDKRDKLIQNILLDAEERDHLFRELQQNLHNKHEHDHV